MRHLVALSCSLSDTIEINKERTMRSVAETFSFNALSIAQREPAVSRERERELAQRWCEGGDRSARDLLVRAQLRHVVAIARRYRRHSGATLEELVAEGNFGLMRALDKFDPDRGTRFVTYAVYWIRAYISQYLVRTRSLVTSGVQSKSLSKIRHAREDIVKVGGDSTNLNEEIARRLTLSSEKLHSLLERMNVRDQPWDPHTEDTPAGWGRGTAQLLSGDTEERMISAETDARRAQAIALVLSQLDDRERYIVQRRLMAYPEEELSLADIGRHFGVSRERARQLEARALRKVKDGLARSSLGADL
jgi:RNA polymerase sigma-32 factor